MNNQNIEPIQINLSLDMKDFDESLKQIQKDTVDFSTNMQQIIGSISLATLAQDFIKHGIQIQLGMQDSFSVVANESNNLQVQINQLALSSLSTLSNVINQSVIPSFGQLYVSGLQSRDSVHNLVQVLSNLTTVFLSLDCKSSIIANVTSINELKETFENVEKTTANFSKQLNNINAKSTEDTLSSVLDITSDLSSNFNDLKDIGSKSITKITTDLSSLSETTVDVAKGTALISEEAIWMGETTKETTKKTNAFGTALGALSTVTTVASIGMLVYQLGDLAGIWDAEKTATQLAIEETKKATEEFNNLKEAGVAIAEEGATRIDYYSTLKSELDTIVDANGKVKDSYHDRAGFIISQLSEATGLEIEMIDGVIQNYSELSGEIENTIAQKRAKIILDSKEDAYSEAILNQAEAQKKVNEAEKDYLYMLNDKSSWEADFREKMKNSYRTEEELVTAMNSTYDTMLSERKELYDEASKELGGYQDTILEYENMSADMIEGNYDKINQSISGTTSLYTANAEEQQKIMQENLDIQFSDLRAFNDRKDEMDEETFEKEKARKEASLMSTIEQLTGMENAVWESSPQYREAMDYLMEQGMEAFDEKGNLTEKAQEKMDELAAEALGVGAEQYQDVMTALSSAGVQAFDENGNMTESARKIVDGLANETLGGSSVKYQAAVQALANSGVDVFDENGDLTDVAKDQMSALEGDFSSEHFKTAENAYKDLADRGVEAFDENGDLTQAGRDSVQGLIDAIGEKKATALLKIQTLAKDMLQKYKDEMEIKSPSKKMKKLGKFTMEGLEEAIDEGGKDIVADIVDLASDITDAFSDNLMLDVDDMIKGNPSLELSYSLVNEEFGELGDLQSNLKSKVQNAMSIKAKQPEQKVFNYYIEQNVSNSGDTSPSQLASQTEALAKRLKWGV